MERIDENTVNYAGIDNTWEMIDVERVIARIEELEKTKGDAKELERHRDLLFSIRGSAGDIEWFGDYYPEWLIREDYFIDNLKMDVDEFCHAKTIANYIVIDWEMTAARVREDYQAIDVGGVRYWHLVVPKAESVVYTDKGAYEGLGLDG
jgi:hypothetical protein